MGTPFLALNTKDGVTPKVKQYLLATPQDPVASEATFGALEAAGGVLHHPMNRVVQFGAPDTWYAVSHVTIHKTTDAGLTWSTAKTLTAGSTAASILKSGLHIVDNSGAPMMVCMYQTTTAAQFRCTTSMDGTTWTDHGPFGITAVNNSGWTDEFVFNNVLYCVLTSNTTTIYTHVLIFDPVGGGFSVLVITNIGQTGSTFVQFNGSLYLLHKNSNTDIVLTDITSGSVDIVLTFTTAAATTSGTRFGAFVDPATNDLICAFWETTALGWRFFRITSALSSSEITSSVRPSAMRGTTAGGTSPNTSLVRHWVDQEAQPGGTADVYFYYATSNALGATMTLFKWNGVASVMTIEDTGGNAAHALGIRADMDGGQYSWSSGEKYFEPVSPYRVPVAGGVKIYFKLRSASGTAAVKVRAWTRRPGASPKQHRTNVATEVSNPSNGALSGTGVGNYNTGLIANNSTTYNLTILLSGVGFSLVERGRYIIDVVDDV